MSLSYSTALQSTLQRLFDTCVIAEEKYPEVDNCLKQILKGQQRYQALTNTTSVPWYLTGIMHKTTCECDFKTHLLNNDSLNGRTTNIPIGYPKKGRPPFTWEQSAENTFQFYRLDKWSDWSVPGMLYNLEVINGESYNNDALLLSKVWSFSNHFESKKNNDPGKCGSAILLRRMAETQVISAETSYEKRLSDIIKLGAEVPYLPNRSLPKAHELQLLLNLNGAYLRKDGRAGNFTAKAYYNITHTYLPGDPQSKQ